MIFKDKVFYKYITVSKHVSKWGLYLTGAGYTEVEGGQEYPLTDHPGHHYFHWSTGRRLSEYQVLYITRGAGWFESEVSGRKKVRAGDYFILFPGVWHRFSPSRSTGWNEYWIEFNGNFARYLQTNLFLNPGEPVIHIGVREELKENFLRIIQLVRDEDLTFQYDASGILLQLLGQINIRKITNSIKGKDIESRIRIAKKYITENLNQPIDPQKIAYDMDISYSSFRKQFRKYTGFSPIQYQIELRLHKAKQMLSTSRFSIKEISNQLGFQSTYYFSRLFKQKTGKSPSIFRAGNKR